MKCLFSSVATSIDLSIKLCRHGALVGARLVRMYVELVAGCRGSGYIGTALNEGPFWNPAFKGAVLLKGSSFEVPPIWGVQGV